MAPRFLVFPPAGPRTPAPPGRSWPDLMQECLELARAGERAGEIPVGALVVSIEGEILGRGANRVETSHDPTAHAEIVALREACARIKNCRAPECVLVSTLEPCAMCAAAIAHARLCGIVFGAADPARGAVASQAGEIAAPDRRSPWHIGGICAHDCAKLLENFFGERR